MYRGRGDTSRSSAICGIRNDSTGNAVELVVALAVELVVTFLKNQLLIVIAYPTIQ